MSITRTKVINKLKAKDIVLLDLDDLQRIFAISDRNTVHKLVQRLIKSNILKHVKRGTYLFRYGNRPVTDFQLANYLIEPSYVSLESTLAYIVQNSAADNRCL